MKKTILAVIGAMLMFACQKADVDRELPSAASKTKESKFYNEENRTKYPKHEKGVVLFKLKNNSSLKRVAGKSSTERVFTKAMERANDRGFYKVRIQDENKTLAELKNNPDVEWASLNYTEVTQTTPDDPYWTSGDLWGMANINMPQVWQSGNFGNKQVVVGVIDEGIFGHEDLCQNIWTNPFEIAGNGIDDDGNGYIDDMHGWDWFNNDNEVYPGATHGTHVAGTIGAKGSNQTGVVGVASNVTLISCKFLESYGFDDNAIKAIDYLIDLKTRHGINIKVTSNSWGGGGFNQGLLEAIQRAKAADILFVAAAGNSGTNNDLQPNFPCGYDVDNIIAVGASDWGNNRASFSCFGLTTVDIFAPGTGTISTIPTDQHTSGYAFFSGTSMATPHVSGAAALYAGVNPTANYLQIKNAILNNAKPVASLNGLCVTGGLLDVSTFTGQTAENQAPFYECPIISPDVTPPSTPQNLNVYEVGFDPREGAFYGGYFGVSWSPSTDNVGVAGYVLWFNDVPEWALYGGSTNWVIAGLDTTEPIIVRVVALDGWGNSSGFSNADTVIWNQSPPPPSDIQPPTNPTNLNVSNPTVSSLTLNWTASTDNVGVTAYDVYRNNVKVSSTTSTSIIDQPLNAGTTYNYFIRARDAAGNTSGNSNTVSGTTLSPPPPVYTVSATLNGASPQVQPTVTLNYTVTTNGTVSSITLERRTNNTSFQEVPYQTTGSGVITNTVPQTNGSVHYTYRLKVSISQGAMAYSNEKIIQVKKK